MLLEPERADPCVAFMSCDLLVASLVDWDGLVRSLELLGLDALTPRGLIISVVASGCGFIVKHRVSFINIPKCAVNGTILSRW